MQIDSLEKERKQQRDGRFTLILFLILVLPCFNLANIYCFKHNFFNHENSEIHIIHDKQLYITSKPYIDKNQTSIPITLYPFFFRPVPINTADKELLMTIKGIGPSMAETIMTYRHQVGAILSIDDLKKIPGIGEKRAISLATDLVFDRPE
jgi:competence ComEA-like helix-hairpin-helix protein